MILTKPFINNINAFPASSGTNITFSVLGGDSITSYKFWLYNNATGVLLYESSIVDLTNIDIGTEDIRSFQFGITPAMGIVNNSSYNVVVQTFNKTTIPVTQSPLSSAAIFTCYVSPSFTVQIKDGDNYVDLISGTTITSSSADLQIVFNTNDLNSPAILNSVQVSLYGVDSNNNKNILFEGKPIYNSPYQQTISGFLPNTTYSSYEIYVEGITTDNFSFNTIVSNILCDYKVSSQASGFISSENRCNIGDVKITTNIQYYSSISGDYSPLNDFLSICQDDNYIYSATRKALFILSKSNGLLEKISFPTEVFAVYGLCSDKDHVYISANPRGNSYPDFDLLIYNKTSKEITEIVKENVVAPYGAIGLLCVDETSVYILRGNWMYIFDKETQTIGERIDSTINFDSITGNQIDGQTSMLSDDNYVYYTTYNGELILFDKATKTFASSIIQSPFYQLEDSAPLFFSQDDNNIYVFGYIYNYNAGFNQNLKFTIYNKTSKTFSGFIETPLGDTAVEMGSLDQNGISMVSGFFAFIVKDYRTQTRYLLIYDTKKNAFHPIIEVNGMPEYGYTIGDHSAFYIINEGNNSFGTINFVSTNISSGNLSYQISDSTEWIEIAKFSDGDELLKIGTKSEFSFPFCGNNKTYKFRLTLTNKELSLTSHFETTILSQFNRPYVCDINDMYSLINEWTLSNVRTVQKSAIYEPYGSKFPFVAYNAVTKYRAGSSMAVLLAPTSKSATSSYIDRYAQVQLIDNFNNFLTNQKAKVLKDFNGNLRIVSIYNDIANEYYKELGNGIASTSFEWAEISDFTQENINKIGLFKNLTIIYSN